MLRAGLSTLAYTGVLPRVLSARWRMHLRCGLLSRPATVTRPIMAFVVELDKRRP
jgi:hypothetical protein